MTFLKFLTTYYPVFFSWVLGFTVIFGYSRRWPRQYRLLAVFVVFYVLMDTIGSMLAYYSINNLFFYNILFSIEFIVLSIFFSFILAGSTIKKLIKYFIILYPVFVLINTFWLQGFYKLQTYSYVLGGIFIILYVIAYLWQLYNSDETHSIFSDPVFWFSLAWLFYFIVTVPYFGMLNFIVENYRAFAEKYYLLIDITDSLHKLLLAVGFLWLKARKNLSSF